MFVSVMSATLRRRTHWVFVSRDGDHVKLTAARLTKKVSRNEAEILAILPELAAGWQSAFSRIAGGERDEDTSKRLLG